MKKILIILILALLNTPMLFAQQDDLLRDIMMSKKAERDRYLEMAFKETNAGNYLKADSIYRDIFTAIKQVPSDLCFYFGKNSYYINQHHQSMDWLSKYIELKGTTGSYFDEAKALIEANKEALKANRKKNVMEAQEILAQDYSIDCGPSGMVTCPVCEGETVIITKSPFGDKYTTCTYCDKNGLMTCEAYNKLLRGELRNAP